MLKCSVELKETAQLARFITTKFISKSDSTHIAFSFLVCLKILFRAALCIPVMNCSSYLRYDKCVVFSRCT